MIGVDVREDALRSRGQNAAALGLDVTVRRRRICSGGHACDAVLANLPYVADGR